MFYVVGSGPAGVACAAALVNRGCDVTLLDAGLELEPERRALVDRVKGSLGHEEVSAFKTGMTPTVRGLPQKLAYGSDYPYRHLPPLAPLAPERFEAAASLARGGLSNVWGAAVLPFLAAEIGDWPIDWSELAPHYRAVTEMIGVTGCRDDLSARLPLFGEPGSPLRSSTQARSLLSDLRRSRAVLREQGITFGASRLAVSADECQYCGLCLYGCPRDVPYGSSMTLDRLGRTKRFRYEGGVLVERISETSDGVTIEVLRVATGERQSFRASRLYVACGALSTARLLLRSLKLFGRSLKLLGSQYFLLPWLRYDASRGATREALHTLAQLFIEMNDRAISDHTVHLQVYSYNDLYLGAMLSRMAPIRTVVGPALTPFLERLLVIQGYLHSRESPSAEVELVKGHRGERLVVRGFPNRSAERRVCAVAHKLLTLRRLTRAVPLLPLLHVGKPGSGNHIGGTFPMCRKPGPLESDVYGRPFGFQRVHLVDSSTFPSIPATTITLSIMANAHRIGSVEESELQ